MFINKVYLSISFSYCSSAQSLIFLFTMLSYLEPIYLFMIPCPPNQFLHVVCTLCMYIVHTFSISGPQFKIQVHLIKRGVELSFQLWKLFQEQDNSKVWVKLKWFLALLMVRRKIKGGNQKRAVVAAAEIFQILVKIKTMFQKEENN